MKKFEIDYGSVCAGIESASVGWKSAGFKPAWFAEINAFPSAVLAHHFPYVKNLGDMLKIREKIKSNEVKAPQILVGGTPCQAFSYAGNRMSLKDPRGQLTLEFVRLADEIDKKRAEDGQEPVCITWENVPGVLSAPDNAFGCFLGALSGAGCELQPSGGKWTSAGCVSGPKRTVAWRVLNAQYFGVPQRRKRIFLVASASEHINPSEILFEYESMRRDYPPCSNQGEKAAGITTECFGESSFGQFRSVKCDASTLKASGGVATGGERKPCNTGWWEMA